MVVRPVADLDDVFQERIFVSIDFGRDQALAGQEFGGVDEKGQPSSSGYPTLNITGRIHFGGIEIHYI